VCVLVRINTRSILKAFLTGKKEELVQFAMQQNTKSKERQKDWQTSQIKRQTNDRSKHLPSNPLVILLLLDAS
jgi:hypothetical protein